MFPANILAPSPVYPGAARAPAGIAGLVPQGAIPVSTAVAFYMDSLLRGKEAVILQQQQQLLARAYHAGNFPGSLVKLPLHGYHLHPQCKEQVAPGNPTAHQHSRDSSSRVDSPISSTDCQDGAESRRSSSPVENSAESPARSPPVMRRPSAPRLKFGVSAILSDEISPKNNKSGKI